MEPAIAGSGPREARVAGLSLLPRGHRAGNPAHRSRPGSRFSPRRPALRLGAVPMGPARGTTLRPSSPPSCFKGEDMLKIDFAVGNGIIKLAVSVFITVIVK